MRPPSRPVSETRTANGALNARGYNGAKCAQGENLLGGIECAGMSDVPQISACEDGDHRRAHLWTKKLLAADAADPRERETCPGPEHGGERVERDRYDKHGLHDMTPGGVVIIYT